ncbi:MAG: hypothetical protein HYY16_12985 [Planctomycetes bacterium]|nr:hypothetical protein [Planctomycetota bacterium]
MSPHAPQLETISVRLDSIRASIRRLFLLDGVARLLTLLGLFVIATFVLDYYFILPREVRLIFLIAGIAFFSWITLRRVVYPLAVRISDDDLALFVERHYPELNDRLISAIQLARHENEASEFNSPQLVQALIGDAADAASALDFNGVLVRSHVLKIAAWAAGLTLLLGAAAGVTEKTRTLAKIYVQRALGLSVRWPQRTYLKVLDFDATSRTRTIARGDDLTIAVGFEGLRPGKVRLDYRFATGEKGRETMTEPFRNMFTYTFTHVPGPFEFTVSGSDDVTDVYHVTTQNPPSVEEIRLTMAYPDYLKMQNTPESQPVLGGNVSAPQYTNVRFVATCNEDIAEATLRLGAKGKEADSPLTILKSASGADRLVTGAFEVREAFSEYQLMLKAKNGLPNRDPIRYLIKGQIDALPAIRMLDPLGDENVTKDCERPISAEVDDDNGLAEILFEYRKEGRESTDWVKLKMGPEHMKPTEYGPGVKSIKVEYLFKFESLQAEPGDYVTVRFTARDYKDVDPNNPNVKEGKTYRFAVVPLTQLEKELQDQMEKVKQNLEQLRRRQNDLYERTARLDRKFGAVDTLTPEQAGELRHSANDQSDITDKLGHARQDIDKIRRRGVYNKIFDERAAAELSKAMDALSIAIEPNGPSPMATVSIRDASQSRHETRSQRLNATRGLQSQVITAIDNALRFLDRWSSYQEIVRLFRFIYEEQMRVNGRIPDWKRKK